MPTDNARNQQAFRDRLKNDGGARVEFTLNKDLLQAVDQVRQSLGAGYTRQDALTHLLNQGASTVKINQYREDQTSGQPSRPSQMTVAEHQEAYRKRREADDAWRLNTYLSGAARDAVVTTSIQQGITRKDALEQLIQKGAATMQSQFRRDDPATDPVSKPRTVKPVSQPARKDVAPMTTTTPAPARPSQMTVAEHQELEQFKASLPNAIANAEVEARHVQANGGAAAMSQKERVAASFLANNIHRK